MGHSFKLNGSLPSLPPCGHSVPFALGQRYKNICNVCLYRSGEAMRAMGKSAPKRKV